MTTTEPAVATLVAGVAVDKLTALDVVARAVGSAVAGAGTPSARVPLADGVWVEIDIPKFGEPPPLALDVHSMDGVEDARSHARALLELLRTTTEWTVVTDFARSR